MAAFGKRGLAGAAKKIRSGSCPGGSFSGSQTIHPMKSLTIHSDGACQGNPGPGGWAALLNWNGRAKELSGGEPATTNNRMELRAAIEALRILREPCRIEFFTDSEYLRNGVTRWIKGWKANGWQTRKELPVKNSDLWRELDRLREGHRIDWKWLKGHAGHPGNERCDLLAREAVAGMRRQYGPDQLREMLRDFNAQVA